MANVINHRTILGITTGLLYWSITLTASAQTTDMSIVPSNVINGQASVMTLVVPSGLASANITTTCPTDVSVKVSMASLPSPVEICNKTTPVTTTPGTYTLSVTSVNRTFTSQTVNVRYNKSTTGGTSSWKDQPITIAGIVKPTLTIFPASVTNGNKAKLTLVIPTGLTSAKLYGVCPSGLSNLRVYIPGVANPVSFCNGSVGSSVTPGTYTFDIAADNLTSLPLRATLRYEASHVWGAVSSVEAFFDISGADLDPSISVYPTIVPPGSNAQVTIIVPINVVTARMWAECLPGVNSVKISYQGGPKAELCGGASVPVTTVPGTYKLDVFGENRNDTNTNAYIRFEVGYSTGVKYSNQAVLAIQSGAPKIIFTQGNTVLPVNPTLRVGTSITSIIKVPRDIVSSRITTTCISPTTSFKIGVSSGSGITYIELCSRSVPVTAVPGAYSLTTIAGNSSTSVTKNGSVRMDYEVTYTDGTKKLLTYIVTIEPMLEAPPYNEPATNS